MSINTLPVSPSHTGPARALSTTTRICRAPGRPMYSEVVRPIGSGSSSDGRSRSGTAATEPSSVTAIVTDLMAAAAVGIDGPRVACRGSSSRTTSWWHWATSLQLTRATVVADVA